MAITVRENGEYELFETLHGRRMLVLNGKDAYLWADGAQGDRLVRAGFDPGEKERTLQNGEFYLVQFDDGLGDTAPHLFLQKENGLTELVLPEGLPSPGCPETHLYAMDEAGISERVMQHFGR